MFWFFFWCFIAVILLATLTFELIKLIFSDLKNIFKNILEIIRVIKNKK